MDLILWRHAEAEDRIPDLERQLTEKGRRQAERVGAWLRAHLPRHHRILVSPAVRTRQTADALGLPYSVNGDLAPGAGPEAVLAAAGWPEASGAVLVVGHQPTLGMAAALLLAGEDRDWTVRKGAAWWISRRTRGEEAQVLLRTVVAPEFV